MGKNVSFKRPDGKSVNGYLAEAKGPGIVVIRNCPDHRDDFVARLCHAHRCGCIGARLRRPTAQRDGALAQRVSIGAKAIEKVPYG